MADIIALGGFSEPVAHVPFGHGLITRKEMDAPILFHQRGQEFLNELRTESIATIGLINGEIINIHAAT